MKRAFQKALHSYYEQTGDESNCYQGTSTIRLQDDDNEEEFFPKSNPSEFAYGNRAASPCSAAQLKAEAEVIKRLIAALAEPVTSKKVPTHTRLPAALVSCRRLCRKFKTGSWR